MSSPPTWSYAEVYSHLRGLRSAAGSPSFGEIAKRVTALRAGRDATFAAPSVARSTVFDCFKAHRRRFDVDLVVDIARVLGIDDDRARDFERTCWAVQNHVDAARIVHVRTGLPARPHRFVGRDAELDRLVGERRPDQIVVIHGMAGCGKSELANEAARRVAATTRRATVVLAELRGFAADLPPAEPAAVFDAVVRALGGDPLRLPAEPGARHASYSRLLADHECVLVLDDAASAEQVAPLLPAELSTPVFVTSRRAIARELGAGSLSLGPLQPDAAADLLLAAAGPNRAGWDRDAVVDLADTVGRLPLALSIVASRIAALADWTPADHAAALVDHHGDVRLDDAVARVLDRSHRSIGPRAARALRLIASMPFEVISVDALAAALGTERAEAARVAGELVGVSLASLAAPGRLRLHALVRAHARERSLDHDRATDRERAHGAVLDHLVTMCRAGAEAVAPARLRATRTALPPRSAAIDETTAVAWTGAELENLLVATSEPSRALRPAIAMELGESLFWYIEREFLHHDGTILYDRAVATARELGDLLGEGVAQINRAACFVRLSEYGRAEECLGRAERLVAGDDHAMCRIKFLLAILATRAGDTEASLGHMVDAAALLQGLEDWAGASRAHDNIAVALAAAGEFDRATEHHRIAAEYATRSGDAYAAAYTWANSSDTQLRRGDPDAAVVAAERALELCTARGVDAVVPHARTNLGNALLVLGRFDEAVEQQLAALNAARAIGHRRAEVHILNSLGEAHLAAGSLEEAADAFTTAVSLALEIDEADELNRSQAGLAQAAEARGDVGNRGA